MAQRSPVPTFGDWTENVQYTAFFENARRDKGEQKMINQNDTGQNPSIFNHKQKNLEKPMNPNPPVNTTNNGGSNVAHPNPQSRMQDRSFPELSSDRSNSNHSNSRSSHGKKSRRPMSETHPSSSQPYQAIKPASSQHAGTRHRSASVPKFGSWDELDPQSGDGFTVIFDKVKEQKQQAATNFPALSNEPVGRPEEQKRSKTTSKSKVWMCFC